MPSTATVDSKIGRSATESLVAVMILAAGCAQQPPPIAAPKPIAPLAPISTTVSSRHDAEAVVRSQIHPGAKDCYKRGLESDPTQAGKLVITIKMRPSGEVETATVWSNSGLSAGVASCVVAVAQRAKFDAPGPGGARISIPFNFQLRLPDGGPERPTE